MTLWIQPIFGDLINIPFSYPIESWRAVYHYLHIRQCPDKKIHQLRLFYNGSSDLSTVQEGSILHLVITEPMVEQWVSEYSLNSKENDNIIFHHSTLSWYDARWGDPYEDKKIQYRTSLMIHILVREIKGNPLEFTINPNYFNKLYGNKDKKINTVWYSSLHKACDEFRNESNGVEEVITEKTCEHLIHLWNLYHGTNQHLVDQGRYYDY